VGADVSDTHHATSLEDYVSSVAFQSHSVTQQPGQAAVHLRAESVQVTAFERDAALAAILHNQEGANATPDEPDGGVGLTGFLIYLSTPNKIILGIGYRSGRMSNLNMR